MKIQDIIEKENEIVHLLNAYIGYVITYRKEFIANENYPRLFTDQTDLLKRWRLVIKRQIKKEQQKDDH